MNTLALSLLFLVALVFLLTRRQRTSHKLPPGSLGLPLVGQSLSFSRALRTNKAEEWLRGRIKKYGPVWKMSLFGKPTVFLHGSTANKLIFTNEGGSFASQQIESIKEILGARNLLELTGDDHRRVRNALMMFLKPESLKQSVTKMEDEVREHLEAHWQGKREVTVLPLMKILTFNVMCSLIFGLTRGARRDKLVRGFEHLLDGVWAVPINIPFTRYHRSLKARDVIRAMVKELIVEKRKELESEPDAPTRDLIMCLLRVRCGAGEELSEEEIMHNVIVTMVAGYETSSSLITFILRFMAIDPSVYEAVLREQEEIAGSKSPGESLTWEDLNKMKYTWRVAMETLRMVPPVFGGFRRAVNDIHYGGYVIPKGWQIFWAVPMTQMDGDVYHEPKKFNPNRFENTASAQPYSFVPFGGGPRLCPGNEFARTETLVAIHYLVTRFKWKLCDSNASFTREPMPVPAHGMPVQIEQKKPL